MSKHLSSYMYVVSFIIETMIHAVGNTVARLGAIVGLWGKPDTGIDSFGATADNYVVRLTT